MRKITPREPAKTERRGNVRMNIRNPDLASKGLLVIIPDAKGSGCGLRLSENAHLPFDRLTALSKAEGLRYPHPSSLRRTQKVKGKR